MKSKPSFSTYIHEFFAPKSVLIF